jgi:pimeloyl-ACP methyl ester carboxylesterase
VVAHSIGGLVALLLATRWPHRVSHLALIGTAAHIRVHPELLRQLSERKFDEAFFRKSFSTLVTAEQFAIVMDDLRRVRVADTDDFMAVGQYDMSSRLHQVTASTIVIAARRDQVVSPRRSRTLAAAIRGAELSVLDGGHYLHIERPDKVASLVLRLIGAAPEVNVPVRGDAP